MRLRPSLKHNFTVLQHAHLCQRLFQLKVDKAGGVERTGKAVKVGGSLFGLPAGVVPLSNNSCQTSINAMMPDFNVHGLDPTWAEPEVERVQAFFDNLSERYVRDEPLLVRDTTQEELVYIAAWAEEATLANEADSVGSMEDEADTAAEEKEFAEWAGDTETLAQRAAKRAKASTGDKPAASTPRTPVLVEIGPDNSPRCSPRFSPSEDIDTVIEEVAKDAEAEAAKITADEAAKSAAEEAAKGPTGEASEAAAGEADKAAAGEAGKGPARESEEVATEEAIEEPAEEGMADDQPSSYAAPARVVDEPSTNSSGSQEEQLLRNMSANFQRLQTLHRARQDKVKSRMAAVDKAKADIKKAQEVAKEQVAKDEADRRQQQALLDTQEEDLAAREEALASTLHGKDEEVEKLVAQRTQDLEQKHKDALDALALDHTGKVEKLELEREELKKEISRLTEERDTANRALADSQVTISDKAKLLSEANDSINDLKLKLDNLEGTLSEARAHKETLNKALEDERQLRSDDATTHKDYTNNVNLWIGRLVVVAGKLTTQLAIMGMPDIRFSQEANVRPNSRLTLFFERILNALEQLRSNRAAYLANEARRLCRGALTKVLTKVAFWNPSIYFANALESLPEDADLTALEEHDTTRLANGTRVWLVAVAFLLGAIAIQESMR
nr:translation initiation factor IF-2-like [Aegilops tauschii subsp. strangulata]